MLNDLLRKKMTRLFNVYDVNNSGFLEKADYERIADNFCRIHNWPEGSEGYQVMHQNQIAQWQQIQQFADSNQDDRVSLDEYLDAYHRMADIDNLYEVTVNGIVDFTFDHFDRDKDGYMTSADFSEVYAVFDLDADEAKTAFAQMDSDNDDRINKVDALRLVREFYVSDDPEAQGNVFFGPY
jgi:juvenile hormone diol kinase